MSTITTGDRIKAIRQKLKKSQTEFGKMLKPVASKGLVSRWEKDINRPNKPRLQQIAKLGETTVDYLLSDSNLDDPAALDIAEKLQNEKHIDIAESEKLKKYTADALIDYQRDQEAKNSKISNLLHKELTPSHVKQLEALDSSSKSALFQALLLVKQLAGTNAMYDLQVFLKQLNEYADNPASDEKKQDIKKQLIELLSQIYFWNM